MIDPKLVISPVNKVKNLNVLWDGGLLQDGNPFSGWSLAELDYGTFPAIGFRWNGEEGPSIGTPSAFGKPIWEILPEIIGERAKESVYAYLYENALAVAEVKDVA
jgi:hypothetical protein